MFRSVKPEENRFRFYHMIIEQSLFDEHILTCTWGRIDFSTRTKVFTFDSHAECLKKAEEIKKQRIKNGYKSKKIVYKKHN